MSVGRITRCAVLLGAFFALSLGVGAAFYAFLQNSLAFVEIFGLFVAIAGSQIGAMALLGACAIFSTLLLCYCFFSCSVRYGNDHFKA